MFNPAVEFIGRTAWDSYASGAGITTPMVFENGKAYTMLRDEVGELRMARLGYKRVKK